jgi:multiple sugar transport system substrate-binding protein
MEEGAMRQWVGTGRRWRVLAICVVAVMMGGVASEGAAFDWDQFKGKGITVRMIAQKHPWTTLVSGWADEFEQLTGVKAVIEALPQEQYNQRIGVEVSSGVGQIDVFATIPSQDGIKFWLAGFAAPIEGYLKDPRLTAPDYDVNDFTAAALQGVKYKGTMFALPWGAEVGMMFYRKDLFQKHEVKVPTTLAELEEAAKKLTLKGADGKIEVFGIANRGRREAVGGGTASAWLHNFGGDWLDKSGNPAVNSPEAVRAWEAYSRVLRLYGPPGQTNFQWYEAASMFAQGRSAIMLDQNVIGVPMFNDPEKSRVVGQVGYAKFPAGPVRDTPNMLTWGLCITSGSKNKEAAWLLMQWLTNKRQQLRAQMAGSSTARRSSWESQEFRAADKQPEWTRISLQAMASANAEWLPPIVAALEAKEIVGGIIQAGMLGQDVKAAADRAVSDMKRLIEKTEQKP